MVSNRDISFVQAGKQAAIKIDITGICSLIRMATDRVPPEIAASKVSEGLRATSESSSVSSKTPEGRGLDDRSLTATRPPGSPVP
jgi:hypothetical protein